MNPSSIRFLFFIISVLVVSSPLSAAAECDPNSTSSLYHCETATLTWQSVTTPADLLGAGKKTPSINLPFPFSFYGQLVDRLCIASSGWIDFDCSASTGLLPTGALPTPETPNNAIYVYWSQLAPFQLDSIRYGTVGESPNREFIISWDKNVNETAVGYFVKFQLALFERDHSIEIRHDAL